MCSAVHIRLMLCRIYSPEGFVEVVSVLCHPIKLAEVCYLVEKEDMQEHTHPSSSETRLGVTLCPKLTCSV